MQVEQLTSALAAGDFEAAERLATAYGDSAMAGGNAVVLRQALDMLNDCLHLTRVLRAHLAEQVRVNSLAVEYQPAVDKNRRWQIEA
ncbi:MAG TPA: hypothetical protein VGK64_09245 [Bryobacteraceae bacterium]